MIGNGRFTGPQTPVMGRIAAPCDQRSRSHRGRKQPNAMDSALPFASSRAGSTDSPCADSGSLRRYRGSIRWPL